MVRRCGQVRAQLFQLLPPTTTATLLLADDGLIRAGGISAIDFSAGAAAPIEAELAAGRILSSRESKARECLALYGP